MHKLASSIGLDGLFFFHEEKRSGEPSRFSWASARFCDNVTLATIRYFAANPLKKGTDVRMEMNNFYERYVIITDLAISLAITVFGNKSKKFDFVQQTISRWEARGRA